MKKILLIIVAGVVIIVLGGITYLSTAFPKVSAAADIKIDATPEMVERGRYLANNVAVCMDCHSTRDYSVYTGPIVEGTEGQGGEVFDQRFGFPGSFIARNITPHNLKGWSDGEIIRAFTVGVNKAGEPFFPVMPYQSYGKMSKDDSFAIVAYLRTLKSIDQNPPESAADFPFSLILRTIPQDAIPQQRPDPGSAVTYGKYMTTIAACGDCHTPMVKGERIEGMEYAGGFEFKVPWGTVRSVNITPHATGIKSWTREVFINRFKSWVGKSVPVKKGEFNTVMPWGMYGGMTRQDLGAIYDYLRTVKPVENTVNRFTAAGG